MDQNHTKDQLSKPPTKNDATRRRFFRRISPWLVSQEDQEGSVQPASFLKLYQRERRFAFRYHHHIGTNRYTGTYYCLLR